MNVLSHFLIGCISVIEEVGHLRQSEKIRSLQKIALLFLISFFFGAVFYYFFQNSFGELMSQTEDSLAGWSGGEYSFAYEYLQSVWNHGKYFALLWLLSVSRIAVLYQRLFTIYTGIRNGFLVLFFVFSKGARGILFYLASLFPHCLLLLPLYLFSFSWINEGRHQKHRIPVYFMIAITFFAACLLECKCNLPIMEAVFQP